MLETVKNIAAVVGCISGSIALLTTLCKPIRKGIVGFISRQSGKSEMQQQISEIRGMLLEHLEADKLKQANAADDREALLCLLRNSVTRIYYAYLPAKQIPAHEFKNMIFQSECYEKLGGNSYVAAIVDGMKEWDVLPD